MSGKPRIGSRAWLIGVRKKFGDGVWLFCQLEGEYHDKRELSRANHNGYIEEVEKVEYGCGGRVAAWRLTRTGMQRWKDDDVTDESE